MEVDNFRVIYEILRVLNMAMDFPEFDVAQINHERLNITENRWKCIIEMLLDSGYIKGVTITHDMIGTNVNCRNVKITLKGLEYLHENGIMQKMYNAAKGIKDIIS